MSYLLTGKSFTSSGEVGPLHTAYYYDYSHSPSTTYSLTGVDCEIRPLVARALNLGHLPAGEVCAERGVQPLVRLGVVSLGGLQLAQQPAWGQGPTITTWWPPHATRHTPHALTSEPPGGGERGGGGGQHEGQWGVTAFAARGGRRCVNEGMVEIRSRHCVEMYSSPDTCSVSSEW